MTTEQSQDDVDSAVKAREWPELDKLIDEVKTKRSEEIARQEAQRSAQAKMAQDAERAWNNLTAQVSLDELAARVQQLGVVAKPVEGLSGTFSAALELTRLPKGEQAVIRIDTTPGRQGPRTTVQVQRGSQQLPAVIIGTNSSGELRRTLVDVAQKLLA